MLWYKLQGSIYKGIAIMRNNGKNLFDKSVNIIAAIAIGTMSVVFICLIILFAIIINKKDNNTDQQEITNQDSVQIVDRNADTDIVSDIHSDVGADYLNFSKEEYSQICDQMSKAEKVHPTNEKLLETMAFVVTNSYVLNPDDRYVFDELNNEEKLDLAYSVLYYGARDLEQINSIRKYDQVNGYFAYDKEDFEKCMKDFCNVEILTWNDEFGMMLDGGNTVLVRYGDGAPWINCCESEIYENENFYLLQACAMESSNGDTDRVFQYYLDLLFYKNPDSAFGVTMCYVNTRAYEQLVEYVETSSNLAPYKGKTYGGENLIDLDWNTAWVEGVDGVGAGEKIELYLKGAQKVHGILVSAGYEASEELYHNNGRPSMLQVDFGNGVVLSEPENGFEDGLYVGPGGYFVAYPLEEAVETDCIVVTIMDAVQGEKYDDTCISEIMVY